MEKYKYKYKKKICYNCGEEIKSGKNIFMFQDNEFCTQICRYNKMRKSSII